MHKYYVHHNGHSWFVKTEELFLQQGGDVSDWGKAWRPIMAGNIEGARRAAERGDFD